MKKILLSMILAAASLIAISSIAVSVLAADNTPVENQFQFNYNSPVANVPNSPSGLFINVIKGLLVISGSFALLMLVIGGFRYVTSAGEKTYIEAAKSQIKAAIIGIVIILVSYSVLTAIQSIVIGSPV